MEKLLVSRCLLGHKVRYDGGAHGPSDGAAIRLLQRWQDEGRIVPLCPRAGRRPADATPAGGNCRRPGPARCSTGACRC